MKRLSFILLLIAVLSLSCQKREERLHTEKTSGLVRELLTKLDSADVYAARKEAQIEASKKQIGGAVIIKTNTRPCMILRKIILTIALIHLLFISIGPCRSLQMQTMNF